MRHTLYTLRSLVVALVIASTSFIYISTPVSAQSIDAYDDLYYALNGEIDDVYTPYSEFIKDTASMEDTNHWLEMFSDQLVVWENGFLTAERVYTSYTGSSDSEISAIATKALSGSQTGINAITSYRNGLESGSVEQYTSAFGDGDNLMVEAVTLHDEAVDLYNEYSGANGAYSYRDILISATGVMLIVTAFLYFKSRKKDASNLSLVRHEVFRSLMTGALTMTIGLGITAITYVLALESEGDTYLVMYGLVLFGAWRFLAEIVSYFRVGRKRIKDAQSAQTVPTPIDQVTPPPTPGT